MCAPCWPDPGIERALFVPTRMRGRSSRASCRCCVSTRFQPARSTSFSLAQISFRARLGLFLGEIRAGGFLVERVMHGMQRAVRLQDDHVLFVLRIAEIADRPEGGRNLVAIDAVGGGDADRAAQIFVGVIVERVRDGRGVVISGGIDFDLAQILVGPGRGFAAHRSGSAQNRRSLRASRRPATQRPARRTQSARPARARTWPRSRGEISRRRRVPELSPAATCCRASAAASHRRSADGPGAVQERRDRSTNPPREI